MSSPTSPSATHASPKPTDPTDPSVTGAEATTTDGTAAVLSGRELAAAIRADVAARAAALTEAGTPPRLDVVTATDDEASAWYVRSIASAATRVGIRCEVRDLGAGADARRIVAELERAGAEAAVHGVILQTPLPAGCRLEELAAAIDPAKDVDGAHPLSHGRLATGLPAYPPATAAAVMALLDHHGIDPRGRRAVVVGRSTVVGRPLAQLLLDRDATVTVAHSRTRDLAEVCADAEILVAAVGRAGLIRAEHIASGAFVVDVGTNPTEDGGLVGDVDAAAAASRARGYTPVPGGVGPVTTALLLRHTVQAAEALTGSGDGATERGEADER
ncbi:bifunctional 5,10-methylenetetrahydrofolate dehydrogenase/5,10-methenyltetrahydrofolate cyclohydrolase [Allostreptomyces psammosilenae]|uniref:Bifunctional protein FolD n=1 Tax=Allostreptomyces psammosilenae TaxID=1892865 RepID=A0A853A7S2_9ACTN|nr:bifunctional 5,10-methylenetetrahydrofolate dehydrogenase/5,10-methenyltetrahydrofolate cyclohydrolase [Allostreptomyces psammosilenae]NYI06492.1 methylenetetrahydrofolate dehydrogenase (NADP+)/methenyltetrahydrofolate cyclohydrolase [Allostreptomyces psammosilenae]